MSEMAPASGDAPETTSNNLPNPSPGDTFVEEPVDDLAPDGGETAGQDKTDSTDQPEVFDLNEYGDRLVTVKVDGQELQVPLKDLRDGYMRQADYTRKTQEAAQLRQELEPLQVLKQALETDPQGFIRQMQDYLGGEATTGETPETLAPWERQVSDLQRQVAELSSYIENQRVDSYVQSTQQQLQSLHEQNKASFGEYDLADVVQLMQARNLTDPVEATKLYLFDRAANEIAQVRATQQHTEGDLAREGLKRSTPTVIGGGANRDGTPGQVAEQSFESIDEIVRAVVEADRRR